ncbi:SPW repeat protein [Amorphus sp. 3PC139-8]|uniref:SPW repeat protein n=1 Tax=Amorphus sp. 3PC139-8 TaxID=2735676 RepID=UPI00345D1BCC
MALKIDQKSGWQDWANIVLAVLLFITPWVFQFTTPTDTTGASETNAVSAAAWNAWVSALVVAALAAAALLRFAEWEEWLNAAVGIWLVVSPWLLGYVALAEAMWSAIVLGALIAISSSWKALETRSGGWRATA